MTNRSNVEERAGTRLTGKTVCLVTLGCSKNFVDSEQMGGILAHAGLTLITEPQRAEIIVVNTCAFIESAKEEAIGAILDLAEHKLPAFGICEYLIVTGCLSERYAEEIKDDLPEVDAILGTRSFHSIVDAINNLYVRTDNEVRIYRSAEHTDALRHLAGRRLHTTGAYAYVKIAEGCSRRCTYCAIPGIRGPLQSRPISEIAAEAEDLAKRGVQELILVAQDSTSYGEDLYGKPRLAELLKTLTKIPEIRWIRLLYMYADRFDAELIDVFKNEEKLLPYIDLPIQHASDKVLKRMARPDTNRSLRELLTALRRELPDAVLRTTVMVGFPGETQEDYEELLRFIEEFRFDHLGCFIFSPEEGTAAVNLPQTVDKETAAARYEGVMLLQQKIAGERAARHINMSYDVLLEALNEDGLSFRGRAWFQTPEEDSFINVYSQTPNASVGEWHSVRIVESTPYELTGVTPISTEKEQKIEST